MKRTIMCYGNILLGVMYLILITRPVIGQEIMHTTCCDAKSLLTHALLIGSPNARIYTRSDWKDNFARSVWDMQLYNGRVYIGCGDSGFNRGPIIIWSFNTDGTPEKVRFNYDLKVCQESVEVFRVFGDKMYTPGIDDSNSDENENNPLIKTISEPNSASVYVKSGDKWHRYRTIRDGAHIFDVAEFQGKLYAAGSIYTKENDTDYAALFESKDGGRSWTNVVKSSSDQVFFSVYPFKNEGVIVGTRGFGAGLYSNGKYTKIGSSLCPPMQYYKPTIRRMQKYRDGVVYTTSYNYKGSRDRRDGSPLMFLSDLSKGAMIVEQFKDAMVEDIIANPHSCSVLTSKYEAENNRFRNEIFTSQDLKQWVRQASVIMPAPAKSFEILNGHYYVGLAYSEGSGSIWLVN